MVEKLKRIPFFLFLIPVFFVVHGVLENFGFIAVKDALILLLYYCGLTLLIAVLFWLLFRKIWKTAIFTSFFMAVFFFYSSFIDFVNERYPYSFFSKAVFLTVFIGIVLAVIFFYLKKRESPLPRFFLFLNLLLGIYLLVDSVKLFTTTFNPPVNPLSIYSFKGTTPVPTCTSCVKPNVYFLLFDEYASSLSLKERFNYTNALDDFLREQGFNIITYSHSNYTFTPFSMASVLNMSYVEGLNNPGKLVAQDYTNTQHLIQKNSVINLFSSMGYNLKMYSIFDIAGQPAKAQQSFLPLKTRLITERTLTAKLSKSLRNLLVKKLNIRYFIVKDYMQYLESNELFLKAVAEEGSKKSNEPKFIYAHFVMPHYPYIFDSSGNKKDALLIHQETISKPPSAYLEYLSYTNKRIKELIEHIRFNDPKAVILLCGDHGYRRWTDHTKPIGYFQNLNAVYFPDQNYSRWGDTVSFVNEFRIVFNQLFQANYPLLKDSTIVLRDRE